MSTRLVSGIALVVLMLGAAGWLPSTAAAQTPGSISGVVTGAGGVGLGGVQVDAYGCQYTAYCDSLFGWWSSAGEATTAADGSYTIAGLPAGNYRVAYRGGAAPWNYLWEVSPDIATTTLNEWKAAIVGDGVGNVVVGDGVAVTGIDASLVRLGHVSGVVTDAQTGLPISGVSVVATGLVSPWTWTPPILRTDLTDASGRYELWLHPDTYRISFAMGWGSTADYFGIEVADQAVAYADELTLDQTLQPAATIRGTVTDGGGVPLSSVWVSTTGRSVTTRADGSYELTYLQPGSYTVQFSRNEYVVEWYDDVPDEASATSLVLDYGDVAAGVDAILTRAGAISGQVTAEGGAPIAGIAAYAYADSGSGWTAVGSGYTDAAGNYTIINLPTGNYRVWFIENADWFGEYYDDAATVELASDVPTVNEAVTPNIDAALRSRRGSISGTVTDSATVGLYRVEVQAYQCSYSCTSFNNWNVIGSAYTAADGSYMIGALPAGSYRVSYTGGPAPWHYLREVYPELEVTSNSAWGAAVIGADAADIAVAEATVTAGIDASLVRLAHVSGVATDDRSGLPIEGLAVIAEGTVPTWTWSPPLNRTDITDAAGRYDLWLHPDDYQVTFRDQGWVGNVNYFGITVPQTVGYEDEVTLDVRLVPTAKISGTVLDQAGEPIANAEVWAAGRSGLTGADGTYTIAPVTAGTHTVRFSHYYYITEWYDDAATEASAATFTIVDGDVVTGVDAVLVRAGEITGHVAGDDGSSGLYNISVTAWASDGVGGWTVAGAAHTDGAGDYRMLGLATGDYRIQFQQSADWFGEYYDDVATRELASDVATVNESVTPNIDGSLRSRRGSISGLVTDSGGSGIGGVNVEVWRCGMSWLCQYQNYWTRKGSAATAADGTYRVTGLVAADYYRVVFRTNTVGPLTNFKRLPYLEEVYPELPVVAGGSWPGTMRSSNSDSSTHISVSEGADTGDIDASLVRLAHVTGVVTDARTGLPVDDISVRPLNGPSGNPPNMGNWLDEGRYELWLHEGGFNIWFYEWLGPTEYEQALIPLTVVYGEDATLDVALAPLNTPPVVGPIDAPTEPVSVGTVVHASATFTDPDTLDSHTATWSWGDGTSEIVLAEPTGTRSTAATHVYTSAGVYQVTLRVADGFGTWDESVFEFVVAYDADGGFVTGGGWIESPAGAYTPEDLLDADLVGRATFGFASRYRREAAIPSGKTEFQFRVGELNFRSQDYQWLVVAGARAQFRGTGTVNGSGDHGILLTAVDGDSPGGDGVDRFRIKIWDRTTDIVLYDSQPGSDDDAELSTMIGGGSIVVQR